MRHILAPVRTLYSDISILVAQSYLKVHLCRIVECCN